MKPEKLILEPYRTFDGYDILKHLFTSDEYHLHPNDNFELLLSYLKSIYKRLPFQTTFSIYYSLFDRFELKSQSA